ncbi:MAG: helix-turn-helix transcriptional regulator [Raoultibacter sp.]
MAQLSFGTILREAREKKGFDLIVVARRLRIRPDILEAIEDADFTRMPPRGYTRNMVNAYAHFLGLNPTDITRMYLDECYAYQVGRTRQDARQGTGRNFDMGNAATARGARGATQGQMRDNGSGRRQYSDVRPAQDTSQMQRLYSEDNTHRSKRGVMPDNHYTNFYSGPKAPAALAHSKLPFIIAAVVILLLTILICVLIFMPKGAANTEETPVLPVSGLSENDGAGKGANDTTKTPEAAPAPVAPTKVTFSYEVPAGQSNYLEISIDGVVQEAATVAGPAKKSYDVTGEVQFTTTNPATVKIFQDGVEVAPADEGGDGVYNLTIKFADVLAAWQKANPAPAAAGAGAAAPAAAAPTA